MYSNLFQINRHNDAQAERYSVNRQSKTEKEITIMCFLHFFKRHRRDQGDVQGKRFERKTAKRLGKTIEITGRGVRYDLDGKKNSAEVDIETPSSAIEVKSSNGHNLEAQLNRYARVTTKEPIGYAPKIRPQNEVRVKKKYNVFKDIPGLANYLASKGDGRKRKHQSRCHWGRRKKQ